MLAIVGNGMVMVYWVVWRLKPTVGRQTRAAHFFFVVLMMLSGQAIFGGARKRKEEAFKRISALLFVVAPCSCRTLIYTHSGAHSCLLACLPMWFVHDFHVYSFVPSAILTLFLIIFFNPSAHVSHISCVCVFILRVFFSCVFLSCVFFFTGGTDRGRKAGGRSSHGTGSSGKQEIKRVNQAVVSIYDH